MSPQKAAFTSVAAAGQCTASDGWRIVRGMLLWPLQVAILVAYVGYLLLFLVIAIIIAAFDAAGRK